MMRILALATLAVLLAACVSTPMRSAVSSNAAVMGLVDDAYLEAGAGRLDAAAASLERALRIEPRNAALWHELARIRLSQGQSGQAASLAAKSNALAGDTDLRARNWELIGEARLQAGDTAGAQAAFARAAEQRAN